MAKIPSDPVTPEPPLGLYLHIPFCQVRCAYCDFNTYAGLGHMVTPYVDALTREVRLVGQAGGQPRAHTIFFGGGTPSLLDVSALGHILAALRDGFELTGDCEITLEANPGTVNARYFADLRGQGVNRLSLGVQSAQREELRLLDRLHTFEQAASAVQAARAAGFTNINLDLIFGLPQQTLAAWQDTLGRTLALEPDHLSCYALSLEHGTPMRAWVHRGLLPEPEDEVVVEMYNFASEVLAAHGYQQYEISNWAKVDQAAPTPSMPALACRHNLLYWRNQPYLGFGAGAHGAAAGYRYANVRAPTAFVARLDAGRRTRFPLSPALAQATPVTDETTMAETMMLGMRLTGEGVRDADFRARYGAGLRDRYARELRRLAALGLIEWDAGGARLTGPGRLLGNRVFREFV